MRTLANKLPYTFGKGYVMSILQKPSMEEAMRLVATAFCQDEPLTHYLKFSLNYVFDKLVQIQQHNSNPMLTVVVHNDKGKVIGCYMNRELSIEPSQEPQELSAVPHYGQLLLEAEDEYRNYYKKNQFRGRVLCLGMAAVDRQYRKQNIYGHLTYASCLNGKQHGFLRVETEDTSKFSAEPDLKAGMTCVKFVRYDDWVYKDHTGESRPFKGVNEFFTQYWNSLHVGKKSLTNLAEGLYVFDGDIETIIARSRPPEI